MVSVAGIRKDLKGKADPVKARLLRGFFKTGKGEYGEGDIFIGVTVPELRKIAKRHSTVSLDGIKELLSSGIHEERLVSLLILIDKYSNGNETERGEIFKFYINNLSGINNWDLVDISAPKIVGEHLMERDRKFLYRLAKSPNLWERRISIISTLRFIRVGDFKDTFGIAHILIDDRHDLMHKSLGWMLREVGKLDMEAEEEFLRSHLRRIPRTSLRYAIERFPWSKRAIYMRGANVTFVCKTPFQKDGNQTAQIVVFGCGQ